VYGVVVVCFWFFCSLAIWFGNWGGCLWGCFVVFGGFSGGGGGGWLVGLWGDWLVGFWGV